VHSHSRGAPGGVGTGHPGVLRGRPRHLGVEPGLIGIGHPAPGDRIQYLADRADGLPVEVFLKDAARLDESCVGGLLLRTPDRRISS
jgi:hypothetical protein